MNRVDKVKKLIQERGIDALIIDNPIDLYYLTGLQLSLGRLVIDKEGASLFVDGRYYEACLKKVPDLNTNLTTGYSKESAFGKGWLFEGKRVGFDADWTTYATYEELLSHGSTLIPLRNPVLGIREIKEPSEIELLKKAARLGIKGFDYACSILKEGITEKEVAAQLEIFWLQAGGEKVAFTPHIAFGEGSAFPHHKPSSRALKRGDPVLIDIGVVLKNYHSDMTRVLFFGQPSAELQNIYEIVFEAFHAALKLCKPGVKIGDVDRAARNLIDERGYKEHFNHGLGHGIGLEIHESPRIRSIGLDAERRLAEGMVITIEPGIYLPGLGGVRLEDTIAITATGYENITNRPIPEQFPLWEIA